MAISEAKEGDLISTLTNPFYGIGPYAQRTLLHWAFTIDALFMNSSEICSSSDCCSRGCDLFLLFFFSGKRPDAILSRRLQVPRHSIICSCEPSTRNLLVRFAVLLHCICRLGLEQPTLRFLHPHLELRPTRILGSGSVSQSMFWAPVRTVPCTSQSLNCFPVRVSLSVSVQLVPPHASAL